ncbi:GNAT family protein [Actinosynnema sp. NPDC020468]|uniref:GNAT family N-acetyltransferase n=1 Tax=Actinosynnema sp. NPDC020468 TaxID=3154488 RepID=UPI0033EB641D
MTWYDRPVLEGPHVRLEPLQPRHAEGLFEACGDPAIWQWLSVARPATVEDMRVIVEDSIGTPNRLAWAQVDPATGEVAGTTSYYEIDPRHRGLYIGFTWIGARWQRTALNTNAKYLLLGHAFETLGAHRVGWHTDHRNDRSQKAIERLGATKEGVLRVHRVRPDGTLRDTVVYSMTAAEWPAVKERLEQRLAR